MVYFNRNSSNNNKKKIPKLFKKEFFKQKYIHTSLGKDVQPQKYLRTISKYLKPEILASITPLYQKHILMI